ncbi:ABC transporter ATP-binding protein [Risungbinella massiliensis]|uniref:ABC transporter ATP-binding protein n=1 Tax=Risungbinella massiliensis TaxID=1329796 RepID=UPI0005CC621C|nr:ABC transporter ATP-binding protein [Risungbinella massiliensis]
MLSIQSLSGGYSRQLPVLHDVSFSIQPGKITGLIGLNGAGKSTTIKHILGLLTPHHGEILLDGLDWKKETTTFRQQISYIAETPQFYEELTLEEHLLLTGKAYGLSEEEIQKRTKKLLPIFRMERVRKWFPQTFSKGMQQKLMILCAFLVESKYLIVDEPFVGLDPLAMRALISLLEERKADGTGILMSTHILSLAESVCDQIILLHQGRLVATGTLNDLRNQTGKPNASLEDIFFHLTEVKS